MREIHAIAAMQNHVLLRIPPGVRLAHCLLIQLTSCATTTNQLPSRYENVTAPAAASPHFNRSIDHHLQSRRTHRIALAGACAKTSSCQTSILRQQLKTDWPGLAHLDTRSRVSRASLQGARGEGWNLRCRGSPEKRSLVAAFNYLK